MVILYEIFKKKLTERTKNLKTILFQLPQFIEILLVSNIAKFKLHTQGDRSLDTYTHYEMITTVKAA